MATFQEHAIGLRDEEGCFIGSPDTREVITDNSYPHNTVLALEMIFDTWEDRCIGTATIIGQNYALTAAHNVYQRGNYPKLILAYVGSCLVDGERMALGTLTVCQYVLPQAYIEDEENKENDYALLFFDKIFYEDDFKEVGEVFDKMFLMPYQMTLTRATLSGYPGFAYHNKKQV